MKLFLVFKKGVYRHECVGAFSTEEKATHAAERAVLRESDDYHYFEIVPFELDQTTKFESGDYIEAAPIRIKNTNAKRKFP